MSLFLMIHIWIQADVDSALLNQDASVGLILTDVNSHKYTKSFLCLVPFIFFLF